MTTENALGRIEVSPTAVATIAASVVTQAYGVVGIAAKNATDQLISQLTGDVHRGVDVRFVNNEVVIDLYVIIEYGTRIVSVAHSVQNLVHSFLKRFTDALERFLKVGVGRNLLRIARDRRLIVCVRRVIRLRAPLCGT